MNVPVSFATLQNVELRRAWAHEALGFTPWLAQNLDRISDAIGIPLELEGAEVPVGRFSADILARNPHDNTLVLIENQLEHGDHSHLGQVLTYLTGLRAQTVVWVAADFRDEHLSAVAWLNQNTVDPFAFFAVRLRVVQIADSPYAPLFEVVERPNNWDRRIQEAARETGDLSQLGVFRTAFWAHFLERHPSQRASGPANADSVRWTKAPFADLVVVQFLAKDSVGVFVRGLRRVVPEDAEAILAPYETALAERLETPMKSRTPGYFFARELRIDSRDRGNWDQMSDWLAAEADRFVKVMGEVMGANS